MDNAIWTAAYAHIHNSKKVVNAAKTMIVTHFSVVIKKPEWREFVVNHPDLLVDIHEQLAKRC